MVEDLNSRLRGAMDLSALTKKVDPSPTSDSPVSLELPSLVAEITEANLRTYLEISIRVPLVIDFYSSQEDSVALSEKLTKLAIEANGAFLLGRIDVEAHARVAEAFSVQQAGTVIAVLKGQPFPLFNGNVELEQITMVINKLLEVAVGNGVTERITLNESAQAVSTAPRLPKHHQEAADALNAGENQKALELYQQILRESPADQLAAAGLAQTELLLRVEGLDPAATYRVKMVTPAGQPQYIHRGIPAWLDGIELTGEALAKAGVRPPILAPENAFLVELERL